MELHRVALQINRLPPISCLTAQHKVTNAVHQMPHAAYKLSNAEHQTPHAAHKMTNALYKLSDAVHLMAHAVLSFNAAVLSMASARLPQPIYLDSECDLNRTSNKGRITSPKYYFI